MIRIACIILLGITAAAAAEDEAPARGRVTGTVTIEAPGALIPPKVSQAVAYLASHPALDKPAPEAGERTPTSIEDRPHIAQRNKAFNPDFLVVDVGTWVEFPNWDNFSHNVFSRSQAAPPFDLDRYPYGQSKSYEFSKVGVVQVFCNIHPQMRATVVVTPNRYHARVDSNGNFIIDDIPPGEYELVVWHNRCHETRQTVRVTAGETTPQDLNLERNLSNVVRPHHHRRRGRNDGVMRGLSVRRESLDLPVIEESHPACCPPQAQQTTEPSEPGTDEASD